MGSDNKPTNRFIWILLIFVLLAGVFRYTQYRSYVAELVLVGPGAEPAAIYIEPEDAATAAAANYLAYAIEQTLGTGLETVSEKEAGGRYISILYGNAEDPGVGLPAETETGIIQKANADEDSIEASYWISKEKNGIVIRVPDREDCFGAVKAVTDRWLQKDCGLKNPGELRASKAMLEEQLSGLPIEFKHELRILTQNLRYTDDEDGNSVKERARRFEQLAADNRPDVIGTQECTLQWLQLLQEAFSDAYEFFGCSRLGPDSDEEEWNAVLFRKDRFELLDGETFWLSNTPGSAATKLNYDGCVRICTWVLLKDRQTGKSFLFGNTHLQNGSGAFYQDIRTMQTDILFRQLKGKTDRLARYPGFLTGDFNGEAKEPFYSHVTAVYADAGKIAVDNSSAVDYSFHDYGQTRKLIDYCFCSPKNITILDYRILDTQYGGYVSDHYGILVTALLNDG